MAFTGTNANGIVIHERGLEDMIDVCKKVAARAIPELMAEFDILFEAHIPEVQARISSPMAPHTPETYIPTGSLLSSFTTRREVLSGFEWQGEFSVGGPSSGPNNPVDYAIYEWARGGEHDMFADVSVTLLPSMEAAFVEWFERVTAGQ